MMRDRRQFLHRTGQLGLAAAAGSGLAVAPAAAQAPAFPSRQVRIVTPFPVGAGPDVALRQVAEQLSRRWKQTVVVDNRPGGNGFIAVSTFKQAPADGHELLQMDNNHITTHPNTFAKLPYDVQKDFAPLRMILRTPFFAVVAPDSPYRSLEDIVNAARERPGKVSYGSWGNGSPGHIGSLLLQSQKGVQMLHVPFRDFGQLYTAVSTKQVDWAFGSVASASGMEKSGRVRFITLAAKAREPLYPNIPATAESPALRDFTLTGWAGIFAPASLPAALQASIANDIAQAMASTEIVQNYKTMGYEAPDLPPAAFNELILRETSTWAAVIKANNLRLD